MLISPEAEKLFAETLTLAPEERAKYLERACKDNQSLYDEVDSLLNASDESEDYFSNLSGRVGLPALSGSEEDSITGKVIDQWRLVSLLGRGGMGSVYLAERIDGQFEKQAALKLLPFGLDNDVARARFINERQILATLTHDNIARLLDGGVTEDGTPYFVMDHVEGVRIDEYCADNELSVRQKLALVVKVAAGVQFAHRNLVIHRDLKPTNILVENNGRAKLLDFGIAKVLEPTVEQRELTQMAQRPVTPAYASPEMLRGEAVDVTTDVYSLGVIIYQLVSGELPLDVEGMTLARLHVHVSRTDPPLLSTVSDVADSDLDAIVAKALARSPQDRYASVESLKDDVQRWLSGLPVSAKATTPWYRARKFISRNRTAVAVAAAAAVGLAAFAAFAGFSALRSERLAQQIALERDRAEATSEFMVGIFEGANPNSEGEQLTAANLLDAGRTRIDKELIDQPQVKAKLLETISRAYSHIGDIEKSRSVLHEELALRKEFDGIDSPGYFNAVIRMSIAQDLIGDYDASLKRSEEAVALANKSGRKVDLAYARGRLARVLHLKGNLQEASVEYQAALTGFQQAFGEDHVDTAQTKLNYATLLGHLGQHQESLDLLFEVERTYETLKLKEKVVPVDLYLTIARSLKHLNRLEESAEVYQSTLDKANLAYGPDNSYSLYLISGLSRVLEAQGNYDDALDMAREADRLVRMHMPGSPNQGRTQLYIGRILQLAGQCDEAVPVLDRALEIFAEKLAGHSVAGRAQWRKGVCLAEQGRYEESEQLILQALKVLNQQYGDEHEYVLLAKAAAHQLYVDWGRAGEADKYAAAKN